MTIRLADLTWPEVDAARPLLIVPLGSTEQHGPHLPLDTDTRIAVAVAESVAAGLSTRSLPAVVSPAVGVGASGEHAGFVGTLSVGTTVFEEMVVELGRSADAFAGVVWCNAHGGNGVPLRAAHARLTAEGRRSFIARCAFPAADAHAGRTETSVMLAIAPELVRPDRAEVGDTRPWSELEADILAGGVIAVSPNGVLGDPTGASADEGRTLLAELVDRLVADVARWLS